MIILQGNGGTIELPNPDYPNSRIVNVKTKIKHAMSGLIYSTRYTQAVNSFPISFKGIYRDKLEELVAFLINTKGHKVTYTMEDNSTWEGYIVSDPNEFNSTEDSDITYDVELTLEETYNG